MKRQNPITGTRRLREQDLKDFFAPPPAIMGGIKGYKPVKLVYDKTPLSFHPSQALEGFGLLIVPDAVTWETPSRIGYQVINKATSLPLHRGFFRTANKAIKFADAVLIKYPCYFVQSEDEQRRDERYWNFMEQKHFPKLFDTNLFLPPPMPDLIWTEQYLGRIYNVLKPGDLKHAAKYAERILKEKYGRDWRKKAQFEITYQEPLEKALPEAKWEADFGGFSYRGGKVIIRKSPDKKKRIEFLTKKQTWEEGELKERYFKVPEKVVRSWYQHYPSFPIWIRDSLKKMRDSKAIIEGTFAEPIIVEKRGRKMKAGRKEFTRAAANPGPGYYVMLDQTNQLLGPLNSATEAEAVGAFFLIEIPEEPIAWIMKKDKSGRLTAIGQVILSFRPAKGRYPKIHN